MKNAVISLLWFASSITDLQALGKRNEFIISGNSDRCALIRRQNNEEFAVSSVLLIDLAETKKACLIKGYYNNGELGRGKVSQLKFTLRKEAASTGSSLVFVSRKTGKAYDFLAKNMFFGRHQKLCLQLKYPQYKKYSNDLFEDKNCMDRAITKEKTYSVLMHYYVKDFDRSKSLFPREEMKAVNIMFRVSKAGLIDQVLSFK